MAGKFIGIGGVDYPSQEAKALQVNDHGELGVANVLGRTVVLDAKAVADGASETFEASYNNIPKGAAYVGIFVASSSNTAAFDIEYSCSMGSSFGHGARFFTNNYSFAPDNEAYIIRPIGTVHDAGRMRVKLTNRRGVSDTFSLWIVYYRFAVPQSSGLKDGPVASLIRYLTPTVPAVGSHTISLAAPGYPIDIYPKFFLAMTAVGGSHEYAVVLNSSMHTGGAGAAQVLEMPRALRGNFISDTFSNPCVDGGLSMTIHNYSDTTREYLVSTYGRRL